MCTVNLFNNLNGTPDINGRWFYNQGVSDPTQSFTITDENTGTVFNPPMVPNASVPLVPDNNGIGRYNLSFDFTGMSNAESITFSYITGNRPSCGDIAYMTINLTYFNLGSDVALSICANPNTPPINLFNQFPFSSSQNSIYQSGNWTYDSANSAMLNLPSGAWNQGTSSPTDDTFNPGVPGLVTPGNYKFDYNVVVSIPNGEIPDEGICEQCNQTVSVIITVNDQPDPGSDANISVCL